MPTYVKRKMTPAVERDLKVLTAQNERQAALLDYVAIMADVEIPEEEEEEVEYGEDEI